jgi:acetyl esterase
MTQRRQSLHRLLPIVRKHGSEFEIGLLQRLSSETLNHLDVQMRQSQADAKIVLEPVARAWLQALPPGPPLYTLPFADARNVLEKLQTNDVPRPDADIQDTTIAGVPVRIVRPREHVGVAGARKPPLPVIIYLHGGGWILGSANTHDRLVRELATRIPAEVVFVKYTPAPEAQFPVQNEQAYAVTEAMAKLGRPMALVGDSVGGNMTIAVAMMAKARRLPNIVAQVLAYPVTSADFDTSSYTAFADGPWLTKKAMQWFWDAYMPNKQARKNPLATPLSASLEELQGLPPTLGITDANDVLRDEGEAFFDRLRRAGVAVESHCVQGIFHDFLMLDGLAQTKGVQETLERIVSFLRTAFRNSRGSNGAGPRSVTRKNPE